MAKTAIAAEVDRLYGLSLTEFTKERDALARRLRADGDRDDAASVAELRKPVLAAWVVNRLVREHRTGVEALVESAAAIRAGEPEADERFRGVADDLARAARTVLAEAGRRPTDAVLRDVATTLRAAAAAEPDALLAGRLTEPVEATGFEAMAGAAPRMPAARAGRRAPEKRQRPDRARVQAARKALADARAEARRLAREADAAEREASRLRAAADAAERDVAEAEAALEKLV
ncbi:MAG TPA: hypothetical protein VFJ60_09040 [Gaiella sp.]|nr:hypothetical protein [Gaiella sp.]